jgi:hypothetical protein
MTSTVRTLPLAAVLLLAISFPTRAGLPTVTRSAAKRRQVKQASVQRPPAAKISRVQYQQPQYQQPPLQFRQPPSATSRPPITGPLQLEYDDGTRQLINVPYCPDCYGPCPPPKYCPRGECRYRENGCQRIDYSRYELSHKRSNYKETRIGAALHPDYVPVCRDFWLRDSWPR